MSDDATGAVVIRRGFKFISTLPGDAKFTRY